jgi:hypothetical protein
VRCLAVTCFVVTLGVSALFASSGLLQGDPSQWTGRDVYLILNNSPWSRVVKLNSSSESSDSVGKQTADSNSNPNSVPMPTGAGAGGMNRRGSGQGGSTASSSKSGPSEVTVQWQSALVVQMAAAKKAGKTVDPASFKPLDEYVIALIALPVTAVGGRAASADSDETVNQEETQRIEEHVKSTASILRPGHEPLTPTRVELNQGPDGRMLIHFSKSDPITLREKSVEFRLGTGRTQLQKKFTLKDMEYQGKLEL